MMLVKRAQGANLREERRDPSGYVVVTDLQ